MTAGVDRPTMAARALAGGFGPGNPSERTPLPHYTLNHDVIPAVETTSVIFSTLIYPIVSHWIFGGGWLFKTFHMQDFAGSTVVHLIGATGAFAALLLLGPRQGKYGPDGKPNVIP